MTATLTVKQYHELIRTGILTDADPVELLEGTLLYKLPKAPSHVVSNAKTLRAIESELPVGFHYCSQDPVTLGDGEPEPDGSVVKGAVDDYPDHHPTPNYVPLVIEIADSTFDRDRGIKLRSYARAGIAEYWIVNLIERKVEVYTGPDPPAPQGPTFRNKTLYTSSDSVPLVISGIRLEDVPVSAVLP